ncbi:HEAT repeat domain-containing protein [Brevibacillus ruminantium]|uniref:HEAT repeat domain-containing protein n=1 Tax=Brevibacillus ruminantium TaxID=2950604 RepID=A0ABY4W8A2_9BACL|nr:HEAT repeat domain-containing protein [Brevibacillus ruminantium]USG63405.1 HEAT repeat domain-containing protein [Brevibacillus ruminantium]
MFQHHIEVAYLFLMVASGLIVAGILFLLFLKYRQNYYAKEKQRLSLKYQEYMSYVLAHLDAQQPLELPVGELGKLELLVLGEKLMEIAERVKGKHRLQLAALFEKLGLPEIELNRLKQAPGPLRSHAAYKLGAMGYEKATPELFAALKAEKDEAGRYIIARAIARCTRNVADLRQMIQQMIEQSADSPRLLAEVLADSPLDLQPLLREWINSEDTRLVLIALACLPTTLDERMMDSLWKGLDSNEKEVRIQSAKLLLGCEGLHSEQIHALLTNPDWEIRALVVKALGSWKDESSVPTLLAAINDQHWWVKYHAARSLVRVGDEGFRALCELASRTTHQETVDLAMQQIQEALREDKLTSKKSVARTDNRLTIYDAYFNRQGERVIS